MAKIMVFQHVPCEPLGTLDPLLRAGRHRIRYVNFGREPQVMPDIEGYDALIILGGPMNIGQETDYPHLDTEKAIIKKAIAKDMPVLGICLGAQLIAAALGAEVYPAKTKEIGWYPLKATAEGQIDPVIGGFSGIEKIFQWHGYTFDLPEGANLLVKGEVVTNQAFKWGEKVYGFQFHLESNLPLINRWLNLPQHLQEIGPYNGHQKIENIWQETLKVIDQSLALSERVFSEFLSLVPQVKEKHRFVHRHF